MMPELEALRRSEHRPVTVGTIVRGRQGHLRNQAIGIAAQRTPVKRWVIVSMNEAAVDPGSLPIDTDVDLVCDSLLDDECPLPLAAARNRVAQLAGGGLLIFLDVDCIPHPDLVSSFVQAAAQERRLWMGSIGYLPPAATSAGWTFETLSDAATPHRLQPTVTEPTASERYELFWSLNFAIDSVDFERLGGFDIGYRGYGGEDTDFAFAARSAGVPFGFCPALAFHQHHESHDPPLTHVASIVENARRFHDKWNIWPMEKWLWEFERRGLIEFDPAEDHLKLRKCDERLAAH